MCVVREGERDTVEGWALHRGGGSLAGRQALNRVGIENGGHYIEVTCNRQRGLFRDHI